VSRYRFRHNLIQRYLYGSIGESRRELLHEDVARALETLFAAQPGEVAVQLARHFELAQLPDQAAEHYLALGRRANQMHAGDDAAAVLEHALDLVRDSPDRPTHRKLNLQLLLALGHARWQQGRAPESMSTFNAAAEAARSLEDADSLALAALGYDDARFRFNLAVQPAVALLEDALHCLDEGDSVLRVRVVCGLIRAQGHHMIPIVLKTLTDQAVSMARRLGNPQALYTALLTKALAYPQPARLQERLSLLQESVSIARQIGDPAALLDAYVFLLDSLLATGDIAAVDREMATMQALVEDVGEPFYDYCLVTKQAMRCLLDGQFAEAEALAQRGMGCSQQMVVDNAEGVFGMQMFSIRRLQGRLRTLAPVIAHFVATHSDAASWRPGLALVYAEIGDRDNAQREFAALSADGFAAVPRDSLFQTCLSYLADVCFFLGEAAHAPALFRLLEPYAEQAIVVGNSITCNGAASRCLAQLATVQGDWVRAEQLFRHALEYNEKLQARPWLAHTCFQFAAMLLRRGQAADRDEALALLARTTDICAPLGMQGLLEDTERLRAGAMPAD
jgi:tetratricopeptide (TPR) repeat protein